MEHDEIGPEKVLTVYDPKTGMTAFTVIDNTNLGVAKGGIRMTPTVSIDEVAKLARAMTYKNALAQLPFGGGKSGIVANPSELTRSQKDALVESFGKAIKEVCPSKYVAAPDIAMGEHEMEILAESIGTIDACTGKPQNLCDGLKCGIPHELGSTGYGVAIATKVAVDFLEMKMEGLTVAIEGYGNVGMFAARFLKEMGAKIVAASDSRGAIYSEDGLDIDKLDALKKEKRCVAVYENGKEISQSELLELNVDILIPASIPDVINKTNVENIKAKIIPQGANIPMTHDIEKKLAAKGTLIIPDVIANAGGVISSYMEYVGLPVDDMFSTIEKKIAPNTLLVLERAKEKNISTREAALEIATKRIKEAQRFQR